MSIEKNETNRTEKPLLNKKIVWIVWLCVAAVSLLLTPDTRAQTAVKEPATQACKTPQQPAVGTCDGKWASAIVGNINLWVYSSEKK